MGIGNRIAGLHSRVGRGYHIVPRATDVYIEAWAPTRDECLSEAVRGLVRSFAVLEGLTPHGRTERHLAAQSDKDLLAAVINEVLYWFAVGGEIPVSAAVRSAPNGAVLFLVLVRATEAQIIGAAPHAASLHELRCAANQAGQWSCTVAVDVQARQGPSAGRVLPSVLVPSRRRHRQRRPRRDLLIRGSGTWLLAGHPGASIAGI